MTEERIIAYLLEELPEEEAGRFEEECFDGEEWPPEVDLAEEDLIDDYLRGGLTPERRRRFEENYLTTHARVERVRMAAALLRQVDARAAEVDTTAFKADATPAEVAAIPAAAPVAADAAPAAPRTVKGERRGTWLGSLWGGRFSAQRAALTFAVLAAVVVGLFLIPRFVSPSRQTVVALALSPSAAERNVNSPGPTAIKLPSDADALRVSMTLPEDAAPSARYRVELEDGGGKVESLEAAGQDARTVSVLIPASRLARGTYALRLFALTPEGTERRVRGSYLFSVE